MIETRRAELRSIATQASVLLLALQKIVEEAQDDDKYDSQIERAYGEMNDGLERLEHELRWGAVEGDYK